MARQFLTYQISGNSGFLLWHDPWLGNRPLIERFGGHLITLMDSTNLAPVSSIISNNSWTPHHSNHVQAMEIRQMLQSVHIHAQDNIIWENDSCLQVKASSIWNTIRRRRAQTHWVRVVWHSLHIPKCSFILWLGLKNRLLTRDRMIQFGMNAEPNCLLCSTGQETANHLLMFCPYTRAVFDSSPHSIGLNWISELSDVNPNTMAQIKYLYIAVALHQIWLERNSRVILPHKNQLSR